MQDFKSDEKDEDIVFRRILDVEIDREACHCEY